MPATELSESALVSRLDLLLFNWPQEDMISFDMHRPRFLYSEHDGGWKQLGVSGIVSYVLSLSCRSFTTSTRNILFWPKDITCVVIHSRGHPHPSHNYNSEDSTT